METRWLKSAVKERDALLEYIAEESPLAAFKLHKKIMLAVDRLREFPRSGAVLREDVRAIFVNSIRVEYMIERECLVILGVFHSSRPRGVSSY